MASANLKVKRNEENPEPIEIIAQSIIDIAEGMKKINESKLNRRALIVLLKDQTGLPGRDINLVLNSLAALKDDFIKSEKK